jgi:hypothetical protein
VHCDVGAPLGERNLELLVALRRHRQELDIESGVRAAQERCDVLRLP